MHNLLSILGLTGHNLSGYSSFGGAAGGGAGGGDVVGIAFRAGNAGSDISLTTSYAKLNDGTDIAVSIPAVAGDKLYMSFTGIVFTGGAGGLVLGSFMVKTTQVTAGGICYISTVGDARTFTMEWVHTVQAGDIVTGEVAVAPVMKEVTQDCLVGNGNTYTVPTFVVLNLGQ